MTSFGSNALWRAINKNGDKAISAFFEGLQQRRLIISRCQSCNTSYSPPRTFCPECLSKKIDLEGHTGRGRVYSFTTMTQPSSHGNLITVAMVELDGVEGRLFSRVEVPYEGMIIGMAVEVDYFELNGIILHCFRPVAVES